MNNDTNHKENGQKLNEIPLFKMSKTEKSLRNRMRAKMPSLQTSNLCYL